MGKKRNLKKLPEKNIDSDDSDIEEETIIKRRTRIASKPFTYRSSKKDPSSQQDTDEYDADSEPDSKQEENEAIDAVPIMKPLVKPKKIVSKPCKTKEAFAALRDFHINLGDCMQLNKTYQVKVESRHSKKLNSCLNNSVPTDTDYVTVKRKDQENVTPPESHSTPALIKATRNLNDSLFGFNDVEKKLDYSSFAVDTSVESSKLVNLSSATNSGRNSYSKRKFDLKEKLGFNDMPIEAPKKRHKRKKKDVAIVDEDEDKDLWDSLRMQFEEVEMHELIVE